MFEAIITFKVPIRSKASLTVGDIQRHIDDLKEKFLETALSDERYFGAPEIDVDFKDITCYKQGSFDFED